MNRHTSPGNLAVHPIGQGDLDWVLALNTLHQVELSFLTPERLGELIDVAFFASGVADVAFLIAFDETAEYDSPNFRWFRDRYPRFVYVDRIAVSAAGRGQGLARQLYGELFVKARNAQRPCIVCEVNSRPPNPASDAFHAQLGFDQVGSALLHGEGKEVRYLLKTL